MTAKPRGPKAFVIDKRLRRDHQRVLLSARHEPYFDSHLVLEHGSEVGYPRPHLNCPRLRINNVSNRLHVAFERAVRRARNARNHPLLSAHLCRLRLWNAGFDDDVSQVHHRH